jgi:hypothetical protein
VKAKRATRIRRVRDREYDHGAVPPVVVRPAEYAVFRGSEQLARVVRTADGWRVCVASEKSKLGEAVSPVGLNKLKLLRGWAEERWGNRSEEPMP